MSEPEPQCLPTAWNGRPQALGSFSLFDMLPPSPIQPYLSLHDHLSFVVLGLAVPVCWNAIPQLLQVIPLFSVIPPRMPALPPPIVSTHSSDLSKFELSLMVTSTGYSGRKPFAWVHILCLCPYPTPGRQPGTWQSTAAQ